MADKEEKNERLGVWAVAPMQPWMEAWVGFWSGEGATSGAPMIPNMCAPTSAWPFNSWSLPTMAPTQAGEAEAAQSPTLWPIGYWGLGSGREPQNPVETWLSYTPAAPFFGLRWAFADAAEQTLGSVGAAPRASVEEEQALSGRARRERATLNRTVIGGRSARFDAAPAATGEVEPADAPKEKRKPRLRVVEGGNGASESEKPADKPAAASVTAKPAAKAKPKPKPKPQPKAEPDDLTAIKGVGAKLAGLLNSLGVTRFEELAAMSESDLEKLDEQLGAFRGRWRRDDWVSQAADLAKAAKP